MVQPNQFDKAIESELLSEPYPSAASVLTISMPKPERPT
jgi:hypothetical protein